MKKNKIKEEFSKIQISEQEKNKIFNNIINHKNKKFNWLAFFGYTFVTAAAFSIVSFIYFKNNNEELQNKNTTKTEERQKDNSKKTDRENKQNDKEDETITITNPYATLLSNYRRNVIVNAPTYLSSNKVDLEQMKQNEEIKIDTKKIVLEEEYNACEGALIIKKESDGYIYSTDAKCHNYGETTVDYKIYDGIANQVMEVDDNIAIITYDLKVMTEKQNLKSSAAAITIFDNNGNIVWRNLITPEMFPYEDSTQEIKSIVKQNGNYIIMDSNKHDFIEYSDGSSSVKVSTYLFSFSAKNPDIQNYIINISERFPSLSIDKYIGQDDGIIYYRGFYHTGNIDGECVVKIQDKKVLFIKTPNTSDGRKIEIQKYSDGYIYAIGATKKDDYKADYFYKIDLEGNIVLKKDLSMYDTNNYTISGFDVSNGNVYFRYYSKKDVRIFAFDKDFNYIKDIFIKDLKPNSYLIKLSAYDKRVLVELESNGEYYYYIFDSKLNIVREIKNDLTDIVSFDRERIFYRNLKNDQITIVYNLYGNIGSNDKMLFILYK